MDDAAANEIEQCFKEGETERALRRVVELDIPEEKSSVTDFVLSCNQETEWRLSLNLQTEWNLRVMMLTRCFDSGF